jgi:hypothetical protein
MSILNRPSDGLPSVLLALRRALIAYGPLAGDRLLELCAPKSQALSDLGMARKTLKRWIHLGFFQQDDAGVVKLAPLPKKIEADDLPRLRSLLLRLVLTPENNPTLSAERDDDDEDRADSSKSADFSLAASWALSQDPYSFPRSFPEAEKRLSEQRISFRLFSNSTRWNGFAEWSAFLGVGCQAAKIGLVLNPYFAVASVLDEVFETATELGQDTFLSRLAEALPIIDGGRYRQMIEAATVRPWHTLQSHQTSPCLSAALQTLVERKVLRLEPRSDATQRVLLGREGREGYTFSHVVRLKATA